MIKRVREFLEKTPIFEIKKMEFLEVLYNHTQPFDHYIVLQTIYFS